MCKFDQKMKQEVQTSRTGLRSNLLVVKSLSYSPKFGQRFYMERDPKKDAASKVATLIPFLTIWEKYTPDMCNSSLPKADI